jgi:hypothetical protein
MFLEARHRIGLKIGTNRARRIGIKEMATMRFSNATILIWLHQSKNLTLERLHHGMDGTFVSRIATLARAPLVTSQEILIIVPNSSAPIPWCNRFNRTHVF